MEHDMETTIMGYIGFRDITPIMENQMDKKMEHEMETGDMLRHCSWMVPSGGRRVDLRARRCSRPVCMQYRLRRKAPVSNCRGKLLNVECQDRLHLNTFFAAHRLGASTNRLSAKKKQLHGSSPK